MGRRKMADRGRGRERAAKGEKRASLILCFWGVGRGEKFVFFFGGGGGEGKVARVAVGILGRKKTNLVWMMEASSSVVLYMKIGAEDVTLREGFSSALLLGGCRFYSRYSPWIYAPRRLRVHSELTLEESMELTAALLRHDVIAEVSIPSGGGDKLSAPRRVFVQAAGIYTGVEPCLPSFTPEVFELPYLSQTIDNIDPLRMEQIRPVGNLSAKLKDPDVVKLFEKLRGRFSDEWIDISVITPNPSTATPCGASKDVNLPSDVLLQIVRMLSNKDRRNLALTSKSMYRALQHPDILNVHKLVSDLEAQIPPRARGLRTFSVHYSTFLEYLHLAWVCAVIQKLYQVGQISSTTVVMVREVTILPTYSDNEEGADGPEYHTLISRTHWRPATFTRRFPALRTIHCRPKKLWTEPGRIHKLTDLEKIYLEDCTQTIAFLRQVPHISMTRPTLTLLYEHKPSGCRCERGDRDDYSMEFHTLTGYVLERKCVDMPI